MDEDDEYDALDEALMETFPASDPIAVSEPIHRPIAPTLPSPASAVVPTDLVDKKRAL